MNPCCCLHPCPAAEHGSVTGSTVPAAEERNPMSLWLEEMVSVCEYVMYLLLS